MATISSVKQSKTNVTHLSRRTKATSPSNHRPSRWSDIYMGLTSCLIETRQISDRKLLPRSICNILILVSKDLNGRFVTSSVDRLWWDNCRVRCRHGVSLLFVSLRSFLGKNMIQCGPDSMPTVRSLAVRDRDLTTLTWAKHISWWPEHLQLQFSNPYRSEAHAEGPRKAHPAPLTSFVGD